MKDSIHPNYREVVFLDTSCDFGFVTRSTVATRRDDQVEGRQGVSVYKIEISRNRIRSTPASRRSWITAGRVDKFKKRYAKKPAAPKGSASKRFPRSREGSLRACLFYCKGLEYSPCH
jgi:large subunit ribosomal protein L31